MLSKMSVVRQITRSRYFLPVLAAASVGVSFLYLAKPIRNEDGKTFTGNDEWIDLKLAKKKDINHNTTHYVFDLVDSEHLSGLQTASCLLGKYVTPKGNNVIRPYTPVSDPEQKGTIDFVVKRYENGKFSNHLHSLSENDTVSFKGPVLKWKWEPNQYKTITLLGGGSGITPLYQLIHEISKNPEDKTKVQLFYGNVSEDDILIKEELDSLREKNKDQIDITYFVDKAKDEKAWDGEVGYLTKEYLESRLPSPSKDAKIFVCGPPGFYNALSGNKNSPTDQGEVSGILADLGYTKEHVYKF